MIEASRWFYLFNDMNGGWPQISIVFKLIYMGGLVGFSDSSNLSYRSPILRFHARL
jgi:hypothetical protein